MPVFFANRGTNAKLNRKTIKLFSPSDKTSANAGESK